jgi:GTPase
MAGSGGPEKPLKSAEKTVYAERALLVGTVGLRFDLRHTDPLEELTRLAETAGAIVVERLLQKQKHPDARTYVGSGKSQEIAELVRRHDLNSVIFDNELSPAQVQNLEKDVKVKVIDRTELILDIFATHARTYQSKLQVELAQLEYALPRISRLGAHITSEQQAGGGAGIGMRGPGEKQLESDRRLAKRRVTALRRELKDIEERKRREVSSRSHQNTTVCLVGYTNAGKSTLMNALTQAGVLVEDRLFSTLDTRTRLWSLGAGVKVLLSDTVGFIRDLPHGLVASFHATLEEAAQADLLLHVVDASSPEIDQQVASVRKVLAELKCGEKPTLMVLNKVDRFRDAVEREILLHRYPEGITVSAKTGLGIDALKSRASELLTKSLIDVDVEIPLAEGKLLAELTTWSVEVAREYVDSHVRLSLRVPERARYKLDKYRIGAGKGS